MTKKQRRWQIGEKALCLCEQWQDNAVCEVVRGSYGGAPQVLRDGEPHICLDAIPAPAKRGRPTRSGTTIPRPLLTRIRAAAESAGMTTEAFLESAISREIERLGRIAKIL